MFNKFFRNLGLAGVLACAFGNLTHAAPITFVKNIGTNSDVALGSTLSILVPAGGVAAGNSIIVTFAIVSVATTVTVADTSGNVYTINADAASSLGGTARRTIIFSANNVAPLLAGGMITVTFVPAVSLARAVSAAEFSGLATISPLDKTMINSNAVPDTSPTSNLTAPTVQPNELLIGAIGAVQPISIGFTPGAGYTGLSRAGTSSGVNDITINPEFRIVAAIGTYLADGTLGSPSSWSAAIATYKGATFPVSLQSFSAD